MTLLLWIITRYGSTTDGTELFVSIKGKINNPHNKFSSTIENSPQQYESVSSQLIHAVFVEVGKRGEDSHTVCESEIGSAFLEGNFKIST